MQATDQPKTTLGSGLGRDDLELLKLSALKRMCQARGIGVKRAGGVAKSRDELIEALMQCPVAPVQVQQQFYVVVRVDPRTFTRTDIGTFSTLPYACIFRRALLEVNPDAQMMFRIEERFEVSESPQSPKSR